LQVFPKGKRSTIAVGDQVLLSDENATQARIAEILPRRNLLYRSDVFKSKLLAANLDQVVIMVATEPSFSEDLLGRALVAAEAQGLAPLILLNKIDLPTHLAAARARLALYQQLGYAVIEISVRQTAQTLELLQPYLSNRVSILIGQSGMGKSTLLNLLIPDADAKTREISEKLDTGKHTTTFTRSYALPAWGQSGALIDAPGFQEFGLHHLTEGELERAFPEFQSLLTACKFYNCHHLKEKGCAILNAVEQGLVNPRRHQLYAQLVYEASLTKPYK
jgi:ribosome biogenesis GTPase